MTNEKAIEILEADKAYLYPDECYNTGAYDMAIKSLKNEPKFLIDENGKITPIKSRGEWILKDDENCVAFGWFVCSRCDYVGASDFNYCPNCGARMEVDS